ncbi:dihydroxyacetone kinase family protein [Pseudactinotalea sp. HY158]|uniref:dihydroxyacetone kinase family protein n=1 Tax=Pseudactinotalea sp. HY158 TaxID=2654547 RepID=UPI00129CFC2A|nr:dihydroxyacetone kinase family protein [Pseudactinotalea sp. HY158]QGH70061.1 DAK2 domain-containing protein [Pseudactinotalea sp. HY158]
MTYVFNTPSDFASEAVRGLAAANPDALLHVPGGVVRADRTPAGQPALIVGGGSGHYPAFAGWVGDGMAHGAVCGNVFASPSASQVYSVARNAENGGGIILGFGNYAGDVLHFGAAAEKLRHEGHDVRILRVSDDIMSNPPELHRERRGVAGGLAVFKMTGAAIAAGATLDDAVRLARKANDATRSVGLAFDGCTMPGSTDALFHVEPGTMAVGLGIHGEPGVRDVPIGSAAEIAELLVDGVLAEEPARDGRSYGGRVAVILNGLGTVKYEELFVVYERVAAELAGCGLTVVAPEVGEFVTSLDMAGLSLTMVFLDEELERLWLAPATAPGYQRSIRAPGERRTSLWTAADEAVPRASVESRALAARIHAALTELRAVCAEHEDELGRLDAVAGDGDHGNAMVYGSRGACDAAAAALEAGAGARTLLLRAGSAWSDAAGGTSGALWGAALTAVGGGFSDDEGADVARVVATLCSGVEAMHRLGGAEPGEKTLIDAALPFREELLRPGVEPYAALREGVRRAREAAEATASFAAQRGRSRVLGEKSIGTPDPGATSFALLMAALSDHLVAGDTGARGSAAVVDTL